MRLQGMKIRLTFTVGSLLLTAMLLVNFVGVIFWKRDAQQREVKLDQAVLAHILHRLPKKKLSPTQLSRRFSFADFYSVHETGEIVFCLRQEGVSTAHLSPLLSSVLAEATEGRAVSHSSSSIADLVRFRQPVSVSARPIIRQNEVVGAVAVVRSLEPLLQTLWQAEKIILGYITVNMLVLGAVGFFRMVKLIVRPIEQLVQLADQYNNQEAVWFAAAHSGGEFNLLSKSLNGMLQRIEQDKTSLQKTVIELESANRQLMARQRELIRAEKLASVGRMAAGLAHEIGNPLGAVQGYLGLLGRSGGQDDQQQDFIQRADQELQRVNSLIRQLLDFARVSKGKPENFFLHGLLHSVFEMLQVQTAFRDIELIIKAEAAQDMVHADQNQLRQVLVNCLLNSADAIDSSEQAGNGIITVTTDMPKEHCIRMRITDNGIGIAEDQLALIFDPFYTTKEPGKGTGLGLSVSRSIIENTGGSIEIESRDGQDGQGCVLYLSLPLSSGDSRND